MNSTSPDEPKLYARRGVLGLAVAGVISGVAVEPTGAAAPSDNSSRMTDEPANALTPKQLSIAPMAASAALGNMQGLSTGLDRALDAGLSVAEVKEVLVQLYAYAGFPRALNALSELLKVLEVRRGRGIQDAPGREAGDVPTGQALLEAGTANQTKLSGAPVKGPLFDFAPAIDQFLKAHLFGDIFARDNLDWQSRELATVGALSALQGVESQLSAHIRISLNVGLTIKQLRQVAIELSTRGDAESGRRLQAALDKLGGRGSRCEPNTASASVCTRPLGRGRICRVRRRRRRYSGFAAARDGRAWHVAFRRRLGVRYAVCGGFDLSIVVG
jgi:alkylhydroperoxidase/carboxymuconolactone decarboxylase family protein YurZ